MSRRNEPPPAPESIEPYGITDLSLIAGRGGASAEVYAGPLVPPILRAELAEDVFAERDKLAERSRASRAAIAELSERRDEAEDEYADALDEAAREGLPRPASEVPEIERQLADAVEVDSVFRRLLYEAAEGVLAAVTAENLEDAIAAGKAAQLAELEALLPLVDEIAAALARHGERGAEIRWCERLGSNRTTQPWISTGSEFSRGIADAQQLIGRAAGAIHAERDRLERGALEVPTGFVKSVPDSPITHPPRAPRTTKGGPEA